jgi:hypothetical protein
MTWVKDVDQRCQIFLCTAYQNEEKYTKLPQNIPNGHIRYQMAANYTKCPSNTPTSSIEKPLKIYPN